MNNDFYDEDGCVSSHYANRNPRHLGIHYSNHVEAMTREKLFSKSAIASELAYRDQRVEEILTLVAILVEALEDIAGTHHNSASAGVYFAKVAREALSSYRKRGE